MRWTIGDAVKAGVLLAVLVLLAINAAADDMCPIQPIADAGIDGRLMVSLDDLNVTDQPLLFLQPVQVGTEIKFKLVMPEPAEPAQQNLWLASGYWASDPENVEALDDAAWSAYLDYQADPTLEAQFGSLTAYVNHEVACWLEASGNADQIRAEAAAGPQHPESSCCFRLPCGICESLVEACVETCDPSGCSKTCQFVGCDPGCDDCCYFGPTGADLDLLKSAS